MKRRLPLAGLLLLAAALVVAPAPAQAAMWVGVELGPNFMANSDVKLDFNGDSVTLKDYKWNTKVLGGVTFGYHFVNSGFLGYNWPNWMKYFQFAIDFSYTSIESGPRTFEDLATENFLDVSRVKGDIFTVAFLFMGCYGFYPDSVAPFGRVVPYIGVGPALIQSWVSASGFLDSHPAGIASSFNFNRTSTDIGLVAEAGVRFMALKNVSLDVAFRYRWTQPNYDLFTVNTEGGPVKVKMGIRDAHLFNALVRANYHF